MPALVRFIDQITPGRALLLVCGTIASEIACSEQSSPDQNTGASTSTGGVSTTGGGPGKGGTTGGITSSNGGSTGNPGNGGTPPANGGQTSAGAANAGTTSAGATSGGAANGGASSANGGTSAGATSGGAGNAGAGPVACNASAAPAIGRLGIETVVQSNDLRVLVYASQPPGSKDWYLVDALGFVRLYTNGSVQPTPFLDVSSEVQGSGFTGSGAPTGGSQNYDERGLLSIAFPPDYETSGKFYVTLIPTSGSAMDHDLVLEYTRSTSNPLVADPSTRKALIDLEPGGEGYVAGMAFSYAKYHNGSTVLFGPDGMLYVGMGDGGGDCNAARRGAPQDVSLPYGKILRLDPKQPAPYAAAGNPFAGDGDARVFHYGLRNPFRFTFDALTKDLYIGEVGQWTNDCIAHAPGDAKGVNFGWPSYECVTENPSAECANTTELRAGSTRKAPIFNLPHGSQGGVSNLIVAIVGGAVYRGSAIPALQGAYLFAEFYPNRPLRALYQCGEDTSEVTLIQKRCDPNTPNAACFTPVNGAPQLSQVGAIVQGSDGELYIPANGNTLMKIVPAP